MLDDLLCECFLLLQSCVLINCLLYEFVILASFLFDPLFKKSDLVESLLMMLLFESARRVCTLTVGLDVDEWRL